MDELAEVAMTDEVFDLSSELMALNHVVAMVMMEAIEFISVVEGVRHHRGGPLQVVLRLDLHQDLGRRGKERGVVVVAGRSVDQVSRSP